jgi:hypothetical protein
LLNENSKEPTIQTSLWSAISAGRDLVIETRHWLRNALEKFARNRAEHCTYDALLKMYKRVFEAFVESGNAYCIATPSKLLCRCEGKEGRLLRDGEIRGYNEREQREEELSSGGCASAVKSGECQRCTIGREVTGRRGRGG